MDSLDHLRRRRGAATPQDQVAGFVFTGVLEFATRALGATTVAESRQASRLPKHLIAFLKYPVADFLRLAELLVLEMVKGGGSEEGALEALGVAGVEAFLNSSVGQIMKALNGGNVHRMLAHTPTAYRTVYTYGERECERTGERAARVRYRNDFMGPAVQTGVLKIGLGPTCNVEISAKVAEVDPDGRNFVIEVQW